MLPALLPCVLALQPAGFAARPVVQRLLASPAARVPDDPDEGNAIFKPYTPGEEDEIAVPDSSKRLFALVLALPAIALLVGIATYNPTADELEEDRLRKATRLRGGSTTPAGSNQFGRWLLDGALASPLYKLLLVPQAKATMVRTAEDNGVPWRQAVDWVRAQGPWQLSAAEQSESVDVPAYYKQPFHAYEEGNLCWDAALEGEVASRAVGARNFPQYGADGELAFRGAFDEALEALGAALPDGGTCVDLGCGTGISTRRIAARFPRAASIVGLDLSPHFLQVGNRLEALGRAKAEAARRGDAAGDAADDAADDAAGAAAWAWVNDCAGYGDPRVELRRGLAEATGLPDASVDVVSVSLVIHELPPDATQAVCREAWRVLRPGGQLWLTEMDFGTPAFRKLRANPLLFALIRSTEPYLDVYADYQPQLAPDLCALGFGPVRLAAATGRHFALVASKPTPEAALAAGGPIDDRRAETAKTDTHLQTWESKSRPQE